MYFSNEAVVLLSVSYACSTYPRVFSNYCVLEILVDTTNFVKLLNLIKSENFLVNFKKLQHLQHCDPSGDLIELQHYLGHVLWAAIFRKLSYFIESNASLWNTPSCQSHLQKIRGLKVIPVAFFSFVKIQKYPL